jgi:hypothetical protein
MDHPYKSAPDRAFWKRGFQPGWEASVFDNDLPLILRGEKVMSAGSCFAANIIPFLEKAGFHYIRRDVAPASLSSVAEDHFNYSRFSASYGNIYTVGQATQLLKRALGRFWPKEDRWIIDCNLIVDPFRPALRYPAVSEREFDLLTAQHLANVLQAVRNADVFIFTLGLTEGWLSTLDGAVFPACPGTIAGVFDPARHVFHNFSVGEVTNDLHELVDLLREINPKIRIVLTVSPVPLVATATSNHVLSATTYSKSILRVAAEDVSVQRSGVAYFPAYEIVTGPQAPYEFFAANRRDPSSHAIEAVMRVFLSRCEINPSYRRDGMEGIDSSEEAPADIRVSDLAPERFSNRLSALISEAQCEEEAAASKSLSE